MGRYKLRFAAALFGLWIFQAPSTQAANGELVIGIAQFPSSFHPNIDSMLAKTYIQSMTARPFTAYDKDWKLICMLCTDLPMMENGRAKPERAPNGKQGVAVT